MTPSKPHVRSARTEDLEVLVAGNMALAEETELMHLDVETLREGIRALLESRAPGRYWIAEIEGRVVGQLLITFEWSDWRNRMVWWIQSVYVEPDTRGRGILRTLYDVVRREARAAGAGGLRLYVNTHNVRAQAIYAALGMNGDHYRVFEDMFTEPPEQPLLAVGVECYAGHRGEQTPRRLILGDRQVEVAEVLDAWLAPDHRYFKLKGADGGTYLVRHDEQAGVWELTMFRAAGA